MPDFSKLFKKRLSEADYTQLKIYFAGSKTFDDLKPSARSVLTALTKQQLTRSYEEEEKIYELQQKLTTDKLITPDAGLWQTRGLTLAIQ